MIDKILEEPLPDNLIQRVRIFAQDFGYGLEHGFWSPKIAILLSGGGETWANFDDKKHLFSKYLAEKWDNKPPSIDLLVMHGYFQVYDKPSAGQTNYMSTEKIYEQLIKKSKDLSIFISYGRQQSSALAVLIRKELQSLEDDIDIFVDDGLEVGDDWHSRLELQVKNSDILVSLLGQNWDFDEGNDEFYRQTSLDSPFVREEIEWALDSNTEIYCICHGGYVLPNEQGSLSDAVWRLASKLNQKQYIHIDGENAKKYADGVNELLKKFQ